MININKDKLGLVLEGGGARGAYHIGVLRALFEAGYKFDAITGTSIGAVNGVMIAQSKYDDCVEMWKSLEFSSFFNIEDDYASRLAKGDVDADTLKYFIKFVKDSVKANGVDTSKMLNMLKDKIDEDLLRNSGIDFGIMTVSRSDRKPKPMFLNDMPYGTVADYVMASSTFPGFKKTMVGEESFIDGGLYDNMPVNMLLDKGYHDIIAIETKSDIPKRKPNDKSAQIHYFVPSVKPGRVMDFSKQSKLTALDLGYLDTIKILRGYVGFRYCIDVSDRTPFGYGFADLSEYACMKVSSCIGAVYESSKIMVSNLARLFKIDYFDISSICIELLERVALAIHIDKYVVHKLDSFMELILSSIDEQIASAEIGSKYMQELKIVKLICSECLDSI